jgi:hypothetical protein
MNSRSIDCTELKDRAEGVFSCIILWCPDFPPAAKTTAAREFNELIELIHSILEGTRRDDSKQWLRICLDEVRQSRKHYENGNARKGRDLIQRAEEHFRNALAKKQIAPRFVVGESGLAQDADTGFPA